ncbi:MAG TPA: hypothetical protein VF085_04875 [Solirubrobacterales bacterium]
MGRGGRDSIRALVVATAIGGCFAAVAYATTRTQPASGGVDRAGPRPPKPRITKGPKAQATSIGARFGFTDRQPGVRFECRLDRTAWKICRSPISFARVGVGRHSFSVRAVDRRDRRSATTRFRWTILETKDFSIVPDLSGLTALFPGADPVALPLTVQNPNPVPIFVTRLEVSVAADPPGCASTDNLAIDQSNASRSAPLAVPPQGAIRLPARGVLPPMLQLRDLPVNQDACQGAQFPLEFKGSARG